MNTPAQTVQLTLEIDYLTTTSTSSF